MQFYFLCIVILLYGAQFVCEGYKSSSCAGRDFGFGSVVCVCNLTYCDTINPIEKIPQNEALMYETNKAGARFQQSTLKFSSSHKSGATIVAVNKAKKFQFILGFGGAFTDAAGINIVSLPLKMQRDLLKGYYSSNGIEYTMGRVPMASCDFSTHIYSYNDVPNDFSLTNFALTEEDLKYKIPLIKTAMLLSKEDLLLFGSPWSSPAWMKTNNNMTGKGELKGNPGGPYYQTWAEYFVKFLQAYERSNITFWGITTQNEPINGFIPEFSFQCLGFTPQMQRDFIKLNLGPTLAKAGFGTDKLKLMIMDDQRLFLPYWAQVILNDSEAGNYVSGIAFHWYLNQLAPPKLLDITQNKFPGVFLLSTEACTGSNPWDFPKVMLGSWDRAESYAHDIIEDLLHWSIGWIDWNLALDPQGGPNIVRNFVDSPVIVNASAKEFYRQPMYYALGHFSKFIKRGSVRIDLSIQNIENLNNVNELEMAAFETPQGATVVIIVNRKEKAYPLVLYDKMSGYLSINVSPRSIQSYIWWTSKKVRSKKL